MTSFAIDAHHLSKRFRIGGAKERYVTLRDTLAAAAGSPLRVLRSAFRQPKEYVWALDDLSFRVERGEVVGIIGRNGAGKSTLLKVLSRITEPTKGYADIDGRVGSLLEVGTGFHPELTGRENVYLSGAILGMKKAEIDRTFDDIVAFAEVENFLDTPVKRFSTGMYLRLAFAVAAHLQTEILLVDEILAVGDANFQKKCLGRLGNVAELGRTVLFVSHNMGAVRSVCKRGMVLDGGRLIAAGDVGDCVEAYYRSIGALQGAGDRAKASGSSDGVFGPIQVHGGEGNTVANSEGFEVSTSLRVAAGAQGFLIACRVEDIQGRVICRLWETSNDLDFRPRPDVQYQTVSVGFPPLWLHPGLYCVDFKVAFLGDFHSGETITSDKFPLDVQGAYGARDPATGADPLLHPRVTWALEREPPVE